MLAKSQIGMRATSLQTNIGYSIFETSLWKTALIIVAAACLAISLMTQFGQATRLERGAEIALSRAWQLLHEADGENRKVRPLPLSVAGLQVINKFA